MSRLSTLVVPIALLAVALAPAAAPAAVRYAGTGGSGTACTTVAPCSLTTAVGSAVTGDEVVVTSGTYAVSATLDVDGITLAGAPGGSRPVLLGAGNLATATVSADTGALVRDLDITAAGSGADAMTVKGASIIERVTLRSASGDGAKVVTEPGTSILRDSVVVSTSTTSSSAGLKLREGPAANGDLAVVNVTVYATQGSAVGVRCEVSDSTKSATVVNSLVRGAATDAEGTSSGSGGRCIAAGTNARTRPNFVGTSWSSSDPLLVDPLALDFHPLFGSSTIDAGVSYARLGPSDLDGGARVAGLLPDVGAYEYRGAAAAGAGGGTTVPDTGTTTTTATDGAAAPAPAGGPVPGAGDPTPLGDVAPPALGRTVVLAADTGRVLVQLPGQRGWTPIDEAQNLPVGTIVDARSGSVTLSSSLGAGRSQTGTFGGGRFEVRQDRHGRGMTDIVLRGGAFGACPRTRARARGAAIATTAASRRGKVVRRLWARDKHGRFRTRGRNSVATVRGTRWLTEDRCDGTLTRVTEGAVDVRDLRTGRTRRVRAGRSLLVRAAR